MIELKKVACMIVANEKGEILILKRSDGMQYWNFPGGSVEPLEKMPMAAIRETKEEAGIDINSKDTFYLDTLRLKDKRIDIFFSSKYSGEVSLNDESIGYNWVLPEKLKDYAFPGNTIVSDKLIKEIKDYIK